MADTIGVVIASYGGDEWKRLAADRALPSVEAQLDEPNEVVVVHGDGTLAQARNEAIAQLTTEWVIVLDADDELDAGYVGAMRLEAKDLLGGWLFQPATLGVVDGVEDDDPVVIGARDLRQANYLVIGTMFQRVMFNRVEGFREWAFAEDWDLWLRMYLKGAEVVVVPDAVYRVHVRPGSRNSEMTPEYAQTYRAIREANGVF